LVRALLSAADCRRGLSLPFKPQELHAMSELVEIGRVVVIADTALERILLSEFIKLGAKGYNCTNCFGKGRHETLEDPFTGRSRVRIEVLAKPDVALAILKYVHNKEFGRYPVAAFMDTVKAFGRDNFY
jgi:hypothetical protein